VLLTREGSYEEATEHYRRVLEIDPDDAAATYAWTVALVHQERYRTALDTLASALERKADDPILLAGMARFRAAVPDPSLRDPEAAVRLAGKAFEKQGSPQNAEVLALALAAAGRYREAAAWQGRLLDAARRQDQPQAVLDRLEGDLARYRAGQPADNPWE
jgi:tetratricopeptide (TPR) repeat protein